MQREDFAGIFRTMDGYPVTIRLLDRPLHEFLPNDPAEITSLAERLDVPEADLARTVENLRETNPMLGHRGCRLGITYPEITEMQSRAIFEAACDVAAAGVDVRPEVMVPLVGEVLEFENQVDVVRTTAERVFEEKNRWVGLVVGAMIQLPRAALTADEIAPLADFFSFDISELTQTVFGMSRDDSGRFLPQYLEAEILPDSPFESLDQAGVGKLVEVAVQLGRKANSVLRMGICGEHGGDPQSVEFFHRAGLNYVSCSPFRVPVARLAAAQATLRD
jgi:pyruvate,orthophosphate dikinase